MKKEINFPRGVEVVVGPYIINDNNEVLLIKSPKWQQWLICGGHIEPGESFIDACKRETLEEIGIEIEIVDKEPINVGEQIVSPPVFKRDAHFIFLDFLAKAKNANFKFDEEVSEAKWFDINNAINNPDVKQTVKESLIKIKEKLKI